MNATGPGFKACLFHPSLGNEVVAGKLLVDRFGLRFQSESGNEEIPANRILTEWNEDDEKIYFKDSERPELSIYTLDQSILKHPALPQLDELRAEIRGARGRAELSRRLRGNPASGKLSNSFLRPKAVLKTPHSKRWRACPASSNLAKRLDCVRVHRRFWFRNQ